MTLLHCLKTFGVRTTVLTSSLALVACGGGGSDGYYEDNNKNPENSSGTGDNSSETDTSQVAEQLKITLQDISGQEIVQAKDRSKVQVAVKVLNSDKGGIQGKNVRLSIQDDDGLGVTSKVSVVSSAEDGVAIFELDIPTLMAGSGRVQLRAQVDGTTIVQSYVLNINKTSTIKSDYILVADQGVVLNIPNDSVTIKAQVKDQHGGVKAGQSVTLTLPVEMQKKFSISSGSTVVTDSAGYASFTIQAHLDQEDVDILIKTSQTLNFLLVDEHQAEKQATASLTFKDQTQIVSKLEIYKPEQPIVAQGGEAKIRVLAKNSKGQIIKNAKVNLAFNDKSLGYGVSIVESSAVTDVDGYAIFTVKTNATHPIALTQEGIELKASYAESEDIFASITLDVITVGENASEQDAIQRLEIAASYKVNAKDDSISIKVKAINNAGQAAIGGKVNLSLNAVALSNAVSFTGSAQQIFDQDGYVTYVLHTNAKTPEAVKNLVDAGIEATFTTENGIRNSIKITVADEEVSEEATRYLMIDPINTAFDVTKDQLIEVKIKAVGVEGSALKGETIRVQLDKLISESDLAVLGLSLTGQASKQTAADGYASFTYQYKASKSESQIALLKQGVRIFAASSNGKQQNITLNFKEPAPQGDIDLDYVSLDTIGNMLLAVGQTQQIIVKVKATDTQGNMRQGQRVSIGLNEIALNNGVELLSASSNVTEENGETTFRLQVKANNKTELANLVASGITLAVIGKRQDGSSYTTLRKIEISEPAVVLPDLSILEIDVADLETISVLGGEARIKVTARAADGTPIANTPIALALSHLVGARVSLSDSTVTTNRQGEAEFNIRISEGEYDANLIKNGITFAAVGSNLNTGDRIQQVHTLQVVAPKNAINLRLTSDQQNIEFGQTVRVSVAVKDELGVNKAYPVSLSLNDAAIQAGIKLLHDSVQTAANGTMNTEFMMPKDLSDTARQALISQGVQVTGFIYNPKGEKLQTTLSFQVIEAVNPYHLTLDSSKASLNLSGDTAFVTVKLLDTNKGAIANERVSLAIADPRNSTSIQGASQQITNELGEAVFEIELAKSQINVLNDIVLITQHMAANGAVVSQTTQLAVHTAMHLAPTLDLKIKSSKDKLNVRGDAVDVAVLVTDMNGSSQTGQTVTLTIPGYQENGAYIRGASTLASDENGWANFSVVIDEALRNPAYDFVNQDLEVVAVVKDPNGTERRQSFVIDVVSSNVPVAVGSIDVNINPLALAVSENGVYYIKEGSAHVLDVDGKPIANQDVVLDTRPLQYRLGQWRFDIAKDPTKVNGAEFPFDALKAWIRPGDVYYTVNAEERVNSVFECVINPETTQWSNNAKPLRVIRFIGSDEVNPSTATYRTDRFGRFDFQIEYPKAYAHWVTVEIGATATVAQTPVRSRTIYTLSALAPDYLSDGSAGPNVQSPYLNCNN